MFFSFPHIYSALFTLFTIAQNIEVQDTQTNQDAIDQLSNTTQPINTVNETGSDFANLNINKENNSNEPNTNETIQSDTLCICHFLV